jgi:preprotein translocase subunit SecF
MLLPEKQIDFMGVRKIAGIGSIVLIIVSIVSLAFNSLEFGLDFTSGTSVRLSYSEAVVVADVNQTLRENGYEDAVLSLIHI